MTTGTNQKQSPRKPHTIVFRCLFLAIATQIAQNTILITIAPTSPTILLEVHDHRVDGKAVSGVRVDFRNRRVAFRTQDILHLHRLDDT